MLKKFGMIVSVVALLTLALVGCKNGMLGEDDATVNGEREAGGRTAKVTITNFADNGNGATRSVVGGPLRTIAPEQPDVKDAATYVFVVHGIARGVEYGPKYIDVDTNTGRINLANLDPAVWNITVTMFNKAKLEAELTTAVVSTDDVQAKTALTTHKDAAAVLSGAGTVDLVRSNSDVSITLTPRGIKGSASVSLTVEINTEDQPDVRTGNYGVTYGLYDKITGAEILVNGQPTLDTQLSAGALTGGGYIYSANGEEIPAGEYLFKVTINPSKSGGKGPWVWSDIIVVESNLGITKKIDLPKLIGEVPNAPSNFVVYWDPDDVNQAREEYTVHFAWDRQSYNEQNFTLQIVDITGKLNKSFDEYNNGGTVLNVSVAGHQQLWENAIEVDFVDLETDSEKTLGINFQTTNYPIYGKSGSLLAGNTSIDYILKTGHVYAVRLAAENANGKSTWVYPGNTDPAEIASTWKDGGAHANGARIEEDAISVFTITYDLTGYKLVQEGAPVNDGKTTFVEAKAFDPTVPAAISYIPYSRTNQRGYLIYKDGVAMGMNGANADGLNTPWDSWLGQTGTNIVIREGADTYDDYKNLVLQPNSISSGNALLDVDSAGTYKDQLTKDKLFIKLDARQMATMTDAEKLSRHTTDMSGNLANQGVGMKGAAEPYIFNLDETGDDYLHLAIGDSHDKLGTITDVNNKEAVVDSVEFSILRNDGYSVKTISGSPATPLSMNIGHLGGDYRLVVIAKSKSGISFTYEVSVIIKNKNEAC